MESNKSINILKEVCDKNFKDLKDEDFESAANSAVHRFVALLLICLFGFGKFYILLCIEIFY